MIYIDEMEVVDEYFDAIEKDQNSYSANEFKKLICDIDPRIKEMQACNVRWCSYNHKASESAA